MQTPLSKLRTRRTRDRQKLAGKASVGHGGLANHPFWGGVIGFMLWTGALLLIYGRPRLPPQQPFDVDNLCVLAGPAVFLLVTLISCALFLDIVRRQFLANNRLLLTLAILILVSGGISALLLFVSSRLGIPESAAVFLLPVAMVPMVCMLLLDPYTATAAGIWTSLVTAQMVSFPLEAFLLGIVGTAVSVRLVHRVRTRSKVLRAGVLLGLIQVACIPGIACLAWFPFSPQMVMYLAGCSLAGGIGAAILALLVIPLFEAVFKLTSDLSLFDLSDLGNPLLQRLALEAPGTYHHSLVVANLAQAAAEEIGANGLLARVGSYYHDIGKLIKPHFFAENMRLHENPHDDLPPSMSTLVITAHVKEGISLAMLHKLPEPVREIIREHHGTGVLSCFHHKARQQMELGFTRNTKERVADGDFRYGGPKPRRRESTIISLADPVEAASRSLEKCTPATLEGLVEDIVEQRFEDGQLVCSELSLEELTKVKRSFVFTLTNMLHSRVSYPKEDENKNQQPAALPPDQPPGGATAGSRISEEGPAGRDGGGN